MYPWCSLIEAKKNDAICGTSDLIRINKVFTDEMQQIMLIPYVPPPQNNNGTNSTNGTDNGNGENNTTNPVNNDNNTSNGTTDPINNTTNSTGRRNLQTSADLKMCIYNIIFT